MTHTAVINNLIILSKTINIVVFCHKFFIYLTIYFYISDVHLYYSVQFYIISSRGLCMFSVSKMLIRPTCRSCHVCDKISTVLQLSFYLSSSQTFYLLHSGTASPLRLSSTTINSPIITSNLIHHNITNIIKISPPFVTLDTQGLTQGPSPGFPVSQGSQGLPVPQIRNKEIHRSSPVSTGVIIAVSVVCTVTGKC